MSASWISLLWLRHKFVLKCQMNGPGFDFLSKKTSMALSCFLLIQNYRYNKKIKLLLSILLEILGMAGNEQGMSSLPCVHCSLFSCPLPPFCSGVDGNRNSLLAPRTLSVPLGTAGWTLSLVWPRAWSNPEEADKTSPVLVFLSCWRRKHSWRDVAQHWTLSLERRQFYATCQLPKPWAPHCIMPIIYTYTYYVPFVKAVMTAWIKNKWVTALLLSHLTFRFTVV